MEYALIVLIVPIAIFLVFSLFSSLRKKEEKKLNSDTQIVLRYTKAFKILFIIFMAICLALMIAVIIFQILDPTSIKTVLFIEFCIVSFMLLGLVGFIDAKYNYVIVRDNIIEVHKPLIKPREISIEDIGYYEMVESYYGGLHCYDKNGVKLLEISPFHTNIDQLFNIIIKLQVPVLTKPLPDAIKKSVEFKKYKKKNLYKGLSILLIVIAYFGFIFFGAFSSFNSLGKFENYEVNGIVERYENEDKELRIYLKEDSNTYYVNSIVYPALDKTIFDELEKGINIKLLIARENEKKGLEISQIEINNKIYLTKEDSKKKEYDNYNSFNIASYVGLGIGIVSVIGASILIYKFYTEDKKTIANS